MRSSVPQVPSSADASRRGAVMVFMVAGIVMLLAMVMFSVDVASMHLVRAELRAATDAAAKAGAESLLRTQDQTKAVKAAVDMALLNNVGGKPFKIASNDVVVGTSAVQTDGSWAFSAGGTKPNAVRINSLMSNSSASGAITLAFGKVFKAGNFTPSKTSTASAMTQEIALVLDRSASMSFDLSGADWVYPNGGAYNRRPKKNSRWMALEDAVEIYLKEVSETPVPSRVALVTWASDMLNADLPDEDTSGGNDDHDNGDGDLDLLDGLVDMVLSTLPYAKARKDFGFTTSFNDLRKTLKQRGNHPIYGSTNMAAGIDKGVELLTAADVKPYAQKTMVLMTDGMWNDGRHPVDAAEDARDKGIVIHVVTFLPGAQSTDAQAVATTTGGLYIHANNQAELTAAFEKLARTLPVVLTD
jgi:Ca-activated chloride channel family protein